MQGSIVIVYLMASPPWLSAFVYIICTSKIFSRGCVTLNVYCITFQGCPRSMWTFHWSQVLLREPILLNMHTLGPYCYYLCLILAGHDFGPGISMTHYESHQSNDNGHAYCHSDEGYDFFIQFDSSNSVKHILMLCSWNEMIDHPN